MVNTFIGLLPGRCSIATPGVEKLAVDVICGMKVKEDSKFFSEFQGKKFYFCSSHCKETFDKNPLKHSR
ncbi:MAG: YHS domain-containing protein [Candidatus Thermoplasmatota archaeon]|jgi:YHS domain-containing protein|nr:YHS domain-containing protein [Candidatus Thermoplasmatota archaeon]MCL5793994.1 YHS domain-containing protein [Candidatus Thermoplasmatota archaeon]